MGKAVIAIHGGAGAISRAQMTPEREREYVAALSTIVESGQKMLAAGASALDTGEHLFAHLQAAVSRVDAVDKCQRFIAIIIVERNHNGRGCDSAGRWDSCRRHDQTLVLMGAGVAQKR